MEAARRGPRAGVGSSALLLALLLHGAMGAEAEEPRPPRQRGDEQCHYYAGGQVYPGEAARVPVTDHSLHLSQAKSRCGADGRRGEEMLRVRSWGRMGTGVGAGAAAARPRQDERSARGWTGLEGGSFVLSFALEIPKSRLARSLCPCRSTSALPQRSGR